MVRTANMWFERARARPRGEATCALALFPGGGRERASLSQRPPSADAARLFLAPPIHGDSSRETGPSLMPDAPAADQNCRGAQSLIDIERHMSAGGRPLPRRVARQQMAAGPPGRGVGDGRAARAAGPRHQPARAVASRPNTPIHVEVPAAGARRQPPARGQRPHGLPPLLARSPRAVRAAATGRWRVRSRVTTRAMPTSVWRRPRPPRGPIGFSISCVAPGDHRLQAGPLRARGADRLCARPAPRPCRIVVAP